MSSTAGLRALCQALVFRFCVWRADCALDRNATWERRAHRVRNWPQDEPQPF